MKNLFKLFPIVAIAASAMFTQGCVQDKCVTDKITCENGGTCLEGICTCTDGYEGDKCATLSRAKFLVGTAAAQWKVNTGDDSCDGTINYIMGFAPASAADEITVSNIAGYTTATGNVKVVKDKFTLKSNVTAGTVTITEFSGTINAAGTITNCTFKSTDTAGGSANCTLKATKL